MNRAQLDSGHYITAITLLIAVVTGVVVVGEIEDGIDIGSAELEARAGEVYGEDYQIVSSDDCWDTCAMTAVSADQQQEDILIYADQTDTWMSATELGEATPGTTPTESLQSLVSDGMLEERGGDSIGPNEYRYAGVDGRYEDGLTQAELRERIEMQLYVSHLWLSEDEIVESVPASKYRVRGALHDLKQGGVIRSGQESEGNFIGIVSHRAYAHHTVEHGPPGSSTAGLLPVLGLILGAVFCLGAIQRYRKGGSIEG